MLPEKGDGEDAKEQRAREATAVGDGGEVGEARLVISDCGSKRKQRVNLGAREQDE